MEIFSLEHHGSVYGGFFQQAMGFGSVSLAPTHGVTMDLFFVWLKFGAFNWQNKSQKKIHSTVWSPVLSLESIRNVVAVVVQRPDHVKSFFWVPYGEEILRCVTIKCHFIEILQFLSVSVSIFAFLGHSMNSMAPGDTMIFARPPAGGQEFRWSHEAELHLWKFPVATASGNHQERNQCSRAWWSINSMGSELHQLPNSGPNRYLGADGEYQQDYEHQILMNISQCWLAISLYTDRLFWMDPP